MHLKHLSYKIKHVQNTHQPLLQQNQLTQSLIYDKVLDISHNLLSTLLKTGGCIVQVVGSASVEYPCEYVADQELHSSIGKESACNVGDLGLNPGLGRSHGEGKGYPLQYSGLENSMDCMCIVHGVAMSWTDLATFTFTFRSCSSNGQSPALQESMVQHITSLRQDKKSDKIFTPS